MRPIKRVLVVEAANRNARRRAGGRNDRMIRQMSGVSHCTNDEDSSRSTFLNDLRERIVEIVFLFITARGYIYDPDLETLAIFEHPLQTFLYVLVGDSTRPGQLHKYDVGFRRDAAVESVRKRTISRGYDGGHHSVPAGHIRLKQRFKVTVSVYHVAVRDDPVSRRCKIDVWIKT